MKEEVRLSETEFSQRLRSIRAWKRWGVDDQMGAVNLVTAESVIGAASLIRSGNVISLGRAMPVAPAANNPAPAQHWMKRKSWPAHPGVGASLDYLANGVHGLVTTHLDALCHVWGSDGMWNGRDPEQEFTSDGMTWGGIEHWAGGIVTRGVLLDVAAARPGGYVRDGEFVTGDDLRTAVESTGVALRPGDAVVVHGGRDAWERATGGFFGDVRQEGRQGLHISCIEFLHEADCSLLVWDIGEAIPNAADYPMGVHSIIFSLGVGILDNALVEPLAEACRKAGRYEFMLIVAPLRLTGGTGSPVNPLAIL